LGLPFSKDQDKQMVHFTVEAVIEGIKTSDTEVLQYIYKKYYPTIKFFVIKNSGTNEDAKDVFQESLILIYNKVKRGTFDLNCAFRTYLYSVCRIIWLRLLEKRDVHVNLTDNQVFVQLNDSLEEVYEEQERYRLYQKHFKMLSKDCQEILTLFLQKMSIRDIAHKMSISSEKYLKKRKYECKENLVKRIQNDPNYKQLSNLI